MFINFEEDVRPTRVREYKVDAAEASVCGRLGAREVDLVFPFHIAHRWKGVARGPLEPPGREECRSYPLLLLFFALAIHTKVLRSKVPR